MASKNFKGLWIPLKILQDDRLTFAERIILSSIYVLGEDEPVKATNAHFCKTLSIKSKWKVSRAITKFVELGYVRIEYDDMNTYTGRKIYPLLNMQNPLQKMQSPLQDEQKPFAKNANNRNIENNNENNNSLESEPEEEEKEDRSGDFGNVRNICAEMYEVLRKKQPELYAHDRMNPDELKQLRIIKGKIRVQIQAINTQNKNPYARVTDDNIIKYWQNFIKFIPAYMLEKSRLTPEYINNKFDKLIKEVRAEYNSHIQEENKTTLSLNNIKKQQ